MNVEIEGNINKIFAEESLTSPQLMQAICLEYCRKIGCTDSSQRFLSQELATSDLELLLKGTAALANCKSAFDIIKTGPKVRGTERNDYKLSDGKTGDIYYVILRAIALNPSHIEMSYTELKERINSLVPNDTPRGVGITEAVQQMNKAVVDKLGEDRVLEWDEEKQQLAIPDPYFLYYLRWTDW